LPPNERYLFARVELAKTDPDGSDVDFFWLGVNCKTNQVHGTAGFTATRAGEVVGSPGLNLGAHQRKHTFV